MAAKNKTSRSMPRIKISGRALIAVVVCVALSAGTYLMFTKPQRTQAADMAEQVKTADAILRANQQRIEDIENGKGANAAKSLQRAQRLDAQLPESLDPVQLAASIPGTAQSMGVTVNQMDPAAPAAPTGNLQAYTFTMSVAGTTGAVNSFLAALQGNQPVTAVSGLQLSITGTDATAAFTLNAYSVTSPPLSATTPPVG